MDVERQRQRLSASEIVTALLQEFSAVTDYRTLRDSLPLYLANLLYSQCVLLYLRVGESLQLCSGSFGDEPGWSAALLAVAHINPISISSDLPEARAWRERCLIEQEQRVMIPLIYRQHCIGIMVILRKEVGNQDQQDGSWQEDEKALLGAVAGVVALLLENTRLLEHDRERIHELALLNSISRQMNSAIYTVESIRLIVMQRAREIASVDFCECLIVPLSEEQSSDSWLGRELCEQVRQRFQQQHTLAPLILERPGDGKDQLTNSYLDLLPRNVQTFFAFPLLSSRNIGMDIGNAQGASLYGASTASGGGQEHVLLGIVFGGYHRAWKLRQVEMTLLQVLTSQASAALENRQLVEEVIEARNEARKLLRQVLDNQRINEIILESIPSGLITTDLQGRIHTFNYAAESLLDYHPYEVLGQSLHRFLDLRASFTALPYARSKDGTAPVQDILYTSTYTGEAQRGTVCIVDRHKQELVLDIDIRPLCSDMGELIGMLVTFTDMTSMHRLEEEKRRLDRLALLGEMAAGVAHEVRNPLASIKTSMQMLRDDLDLEEHDESGQADEQNDWAQQSVTVVLKEVERLDIIVRELLLFAKDRRLQRARCNIAELSDYVLNLLHEQLEGAGVELHRVYEDVPACWVDRGQIEQVLLNLYTNALQAIGDGGILSIACRCITAERVRDETTELENIAAQRSADGAWLFYKSTRQKEAQTMVQWCEIVVSDTGVGIAADQIGHIFQPFYTTKAHGIGLGLAITRRLIEDHGGYIRIESHLGYGATFSIRFPLVTDELMRIQHNEDDTTIEE